MSERKTVTPNIPSDDTAIAYLTGRTLRNADAQGVEAFIDLIGHLFESPPSLNDVWAYAVLIHKLREDQEGAKPATPDADEEWPDVVDDGGMI